MREKNWSSKWKIIFQITTLILKKGKTIMHTHTQWQLSVFKGYEEEWLHLHVIFILLSSLQGLFILPMLSGFKVRATVHYPIPLFELGRSENSDLAV